MKILSLILLSSLASGFGQVFLRAGARAAAPLSEANLWQVSAWLSFVNWQVLAGLGLWVLSTLLWVVVLNRTELSFAYYVASLNYLILPILGHWLFDERISPIRVVGMILIILGVLVTIYGRSVEK